MDWDKGRIRDLDWGRRFYTLTVESIVEWGKDKVQYREPRAGDGAAIRLFPGIDGIHGLFGSLSTYHDL